MCFWIGYFLIFYLGTISIHVSSYKISDITGGKNQATIRRDLNFTQLVEFDGYESEWHRVTTADGYVLSVFRVRRRGACSGAGAGAGASGGAEPLVFMHGLYLSADDCITPGPSAAHCYLYADRCRDVWAPNVRGSTYSRKHTSLNTTDPNFWNFSLDEIALYDTPAVIDYILQQTGQKKIVFVGHSQGATSLMLLCAKRPEYNAKVSAGFALSMTAWLDHSRFVVLDIEEIMSPLITLANNVGVHTEFLPRGAFYQPLAKLLCGTSDLSYPVCSAFYFSVLGYDRFQLKEDVLKVLTGHLPSGTSLKNFNRWGQIKRNGFTEYDYGPIGNLKTYGQANAPEIDLRNVTMKWIFIGSKNDFVSDERDLDTLISKLQDATKCIVSDDTLGHLDYLFGEGVATLIVPMILTYLDTGEFRCL